MKQIPEDITTLHKWTTNYNHMMYGSWDMEHGKYIYFFILDHFFPFSPIKTQKIKILSKLKKHMDIPSFYTSVL